MKLAFVSFYSGLANRGGETYVDSLDEGLSDKHEVWVFQAGTRRGRNKYHPQQIRISIDTNHRRLAITHPISRLFFDYYHLKELLFTIKSLPALWRLKPDVIFPQNSGWEVIILRLFSSLINSKIIISGQSGPGWNDRVNLFVHPDIFVALTKTQASWAEKASPWKNQTITVIPNGVDLNKFSPRGEKRLVDLPRPIILAVGAAIESKRIATTIEAVAKMGKASLLVCGTGPLEEKEDLLGKKLLGHRYKRLKVTHADMPGIFRASDVFTLCSDSSEAFGIVYLEALASGLPCVVTDDASRRETLGETSIFVKNPNDREEYAEKLIEALKQKNPKKFTDRAKKYSWDQIVTEYEKILDKR